MLGSGDVVEVSGPWGVILIEVPWDLVDGLWSVEDFGKANEVDTVVIKD